MSHKYPNPWNFNNIDKCLKSPNRLYRVEFGGLCEIAMGAPIGGECFLLKDGKKIKLNNFCGGPIIWNNLSAKIALPTWTRSRKQKIVIIDIETMTATTYSKEFRVFKILNEFEF